MDGLDAGLFLFTRRGTSAANSPAIPTTAPTISGVGKVLKGEVDEETGVRKQLKNPLM